MKVLIQHLTGYGEKHFCAAGICLEGERSGGVVRLVPVDPRSYWHEAFFHKKLLRPEGGPFDVGMCVETADPRYVGESPRVEDYLCNPAKLIACEDWSSKPDAFWDLLEKNAKTSLDEIFGAKLWRKATGTASLPSRQGSRSLGIVRPSQVVRMSVETNGQIYQLRVWFRDAIGNVELSAGDLRVHYPEMHHSEKNRPLVQECFHRISAGEECLFGVGLTLPVKLPSGYWHRWVQITNIYLRSNPVWWLSQAL